MSCVTCGPSFSKSSWARSVCCWCQFLNWKKYLCSCLFSTNGNKETPFPRSLPPSPDPQLSRYLCKHPRPLLCPAVFHTLSHSEQARHLQEHLTPSHCNDLWTERWWCITANHRQPYNTINGCKRGSPSPQEFSQLRGASTSVTMLQYLVRFSSRLHLLLWLF